MGAIIDVICASAKDRLLAGSLRNYEYNMGLCGRRSEAVVRSLTGEYGIDVSWLRSAGVGYLAPVASKDTTAATG